MSTVIHIEVFKCNTGPPVGAHKKLAERQRMYSERNVLDNLIVVQGICCKNRVTADGVAGRKGYDCSGTGLPKTYPW